MMIKSLVAKINKVNMMNFQALNCCFTAILSHNIRLYKNKGLFWFDRGGLQELFLW